MITYKHQESHKRSWYTWNSTKVSNARQEENEKPENTEQEWLTIKYNITEIARDNITVKKITGG